jgi:hypothetical protein
MGKEGRIYPFALGCGGHRECLRIDRWKVR